MVFTGVRLSWVAFRLGAMINYEFSNLLHNEVTPSNPIKKNHPDLFFFFFLGKYIFFRYFVFFAVHRQGICIYFFPLKEEKRHQAWHLQSFRMMVTFHSSKGTQYRASPDGRQAFAWLLLSLPGQQRHPVHWTSFCSTWVAAVCWWLEVVGSGLVADSVRPKGERVGVHSSHSCFSSHKLSTKALQASYFLKIVK